MLLPVRISDRVPDPCPRVPDPSPRVPDPSYRPELPTRVTDPSYRPSNGEKRKKMVRDPILLPVTYNIYLLAPDRFGGASRSSRTLTKVFAGKKRSEVRFYYLCHVTEPCPRVPKPCPLVTEPCPRVTEPCHREKKKKWSEVRFHYLSHIIYIYWRRPLLGAALDHREP